MTHRDRFAALLAEHGISQVRAAAILSTATGDDVTPRRVRAWLSRTARTRSECPGWPVYVLERELADPEKRERYGVRPTNGSS